MTIAAEILNALRGGIIVSCQPVVGGPMDDVGIITRQCQAAEQGGARGLRLEGVERVRAVASACALPIIGITKRDLNDSAVRITPWIEDVQALAAAGAAIVAYDATQRPRPIPTANIVGRIRELGITAMADCATVADARQALDEGAQILGSTLSGYAYDIAPEDAPPDIELIESLSSLGAFVIAEGRYRRPEHAAAAVARGADAVVVGSAITRIEHVTGWFADAISEAELSVADVADREPPVTEAHNKP